MTLPTLLLGSSGLEITRVGFGAWATGGGGWSFGWGPQVDEASIAAMRHAIDRGVNWIDTAAVYGLGHSEEVEDSWATMQQLVTEGKVRLAGVSNFDVSLLERCEEVRHVDSLQPPFSLIRRDTGTSQIPWCAAHGTGVIVYSPMQSGILTDRFNAERVAAMASDDWRRRSPQVAVAWTLTWPGVTGAIVGARSPEQVDGWIDAARIQLTSADLDEIAAAVETSGAGAGPAVAASQ